MRRAGLRSVWMIALGVGVVSACVISDRQVDERDVSVAGGTGGNRGIITPTAGNADRGGGAGVPPNVAGWPGRFPPLPHPTTVPQGGEAWGAGDALELGGAAPECMTPLAGAGGELPSAGAAGGGAPELGDCFEPLGSGLRCEEADAHAQGPLLERACGATNLAECQDACRERADCTGVSDYFFGQRPLDRCVLRHGPCGDASGGDWQAEDAGKEYVKVCSANGECHLEFLGNWVRCDDSTGEVEDLETSLADCARTCLQDPSCTSVTDYFYLGKLPGCYLYTGKCTAPQPLPAEDLGKAYRRIPCE